jgi:hypothetical protein
VDYCIVKLTTENTEVNSLITHYFPLTTFPLFIRVNHNNPRHQRSINI